VYINRETDKKASGGGGGGGGRGMTNYEDEQKKYETWFEKTDKLIGMFAGIKDGDEYLKVGQICLAINDSDDILANIKADHINISATSTAHMLAGSIVHDENGNLVLKESSGGGIYVQRTEQGTTAQFGVWDKGNLTGGVMVDEINGQTTTYITGDKINISATSTVHTLAGDLEHDANGRLVIKNAGGMYVQRTEQGVIAQFGVWDDGNLTGGIIAQKINGQTTTYIKADHVVMGSGQDERPIDVVINGKLNVDELASRIAAISILNTMAIHSDGNIVADGGISAASLAVNQSYGITNGGVGYFSALSVTGGTSNATWQSATIHTLSVSNEHAFLYGDANLTPTGRAVGRVVLSHNTSTIHYLGY
jgi:hypothetical protein